MNYDHAPIIVTGCPRSGTSLTCGIIDMCGADGGKVCGPTRANPKGQFENRGVVGNHIKPFLQKIGADPMGQDPLPDLKDVPNDPDIAYKIRIEMRNQGVDTHNTPWYFKSCKGALIWPALAAGFPKARWVIVRRRKEDIAASCLRTSFMHRRKTAESWMEWVDFHNERFREIKKSKRAIEVWPEQIRGGNLIVMKDVIRWLGLEWNEEAVNDFVDMNLYQGANK